MPIGALIYLSVDHLAYRAVSNAQWGPWEALRKVLEDLNPQHHLISRKCSFIMVCSGLLYLEAFRFVSELTSSVILGSFLRYQEHHSNHSHKLPVS